ncbi:MAG: 6-phosphogluconolactonase [Arenibacterium sp.]
MKLLEYPDREMLAIDLANKLAGELETCLFNHDHASLAVPGGTTPGPIFDNLSAVTLDWSRVHVMAPDERWVPESDGRPNARLIGERLLVGPAESAPFVSFYREGKTPEDAVAEVGATLTPEMPISILLLGMGADRHVASLFPGVDGLAAALRADAAPVVVMRPDNQPEARMSLSAKVLNGAMSKHLIITGAEKRDALETALSMSPEDAPVQAVLSNTMVHWAE